MKWFPLDACVGIGYFVILSSYPYVFPNYSMRVEIERSHSVSLRLHTMIDRDVLWKNALLCNLALHCGYSFAQFSFERQKSSAIGYFTWPSSNEYFNLSWSFWNTASKTENVRPVILNDKSINFTFWTSLNSGSDIGVWL